MSLSHPRRIRSWSKTGLAAGSALLSAVLLAGCSSVPNAINPVHWYDSVFSSEEEAVPTKGGSGDKTASRSDRAVGKGLSADRSNAKYTQEAMNREGSPTRPLNPEVAVAKATPKVAPGQGSPEAVAAVAPAATSDAAPPPPVVQTSPVAGMPQQIASSQAAPAPATLRAPPAGPESVEDAYRRRLNEFAAPPVQPAATFQPSTGLRPPLMAQAPTPYAPLELTRSGGSSMGQTIHLVRPGHARPVSVQSAARNASGARSLAEFSEGRSAASFDLASVSFGEGTSELSATDRAHLRDVAALYRQKGGTLRIIGASFSSRLEVDPMANREANRVLARTRADAVAAELVRLGVPARKIYAGAAEDSAQMAGADGAEILLDL